MSDLVSIQPYEVGKVYRVPMVLCSFLSERQSWWPILGPYHEDNEIIHFPDWHVHYDYRFLTDRQVRLLGSGHCSGNPDGWPVGTVPGGGQARGMDGHRKETSACDTKTSDLSGRNQRHSTGATPWSHG